MKQTGIGLALDVVLSIVACLISPSPGGIAANIIRWMVGYHYISVVWSYKKEIEEEQADPAWQTLPAWQNLPGRGAHQSGRAEAVDERV